MGLGRPNENSMYSLNSAGEHVPSSKRCLIDRTTTSLLASHGPISVMCLGAPLGVPALRPAVFCPFFFSVRLERFTLTLTFASWP
jgi:hypothetical protein